jgi:hypothetical protein
MASYAVVDANGPRGAQDDVGDFVAELSIQGGQRRDPCRANDVESVLGACSTAAETTIAKFECDWVVEIATVAIVPAVVEAYVLRRGCMFYAALDGNAGLVAEVVVVDDLAYFGWEVQKAEWNCFFRNGCSKNFLDRRDSVMSLSGDWQCITIKSSSHLGWVRYVLAAAAEIGVGCGRCGLVI